MSSISNYVPFPVGTQLSATAGGFLTASKGQLFRGPNQRAYRLATAGATDLLPNSACTTTILNGAPTWTVSGGLAVGANPNAVGIVPEEYTTVITAGNFFLMQVEGTALVLAGDTTVVNASGLEVRMVVGSAASGVARTLAAFTTASTSEEAGAFCLASNTAVASVIGATIRVLLSLRPNV